MCVWREQGSVVLFRQKEHHVDHGGERSSQFGYQKTSSLSVDGAQTLKSFHQHVVRRPTLAQRHEFDSAGAQSPADAVRLRNGIRCLSGP